MHNMRRWLQHTSVGACAAGHTGAAQWLPVMFYAAREKGAEFRLYLYVTLIYFLCGAAEKYIGVVVFVETVILYR